MPIDVLEEPLFQDVLRAETCFVRQARNVRHHGRGLTFAVRNRAEFEQLFACADRGREHSADVAQRESTTRGDIHRTRDGIDGQERGKRICDIARVHDVANLAPGTQQRRMSPGQAPNTRQGFSIDAFSPCKYRRPG